MKRTKQFLSVFLALMMVISIIPMSSITASAVSGSDYTSVSALATKLTQVFNGDIDIYSNSSCTTEVSMPINTNMNNSTTYYVKSNTTGNKCSGKQCYIYANAVYNKLYNEWVGNGGSFAHSVNVITKGKSSLSYSDFVNAGVKCGAYLRTTTNSDGTFSGNYGHSMIILSYNSSNITYLEGNGDGNGAIRITTKTWSNFNTSQLSGKSRYVSHLVQPTDSYYNSIYPTTKPTLSLSTNVVNLTLGGTESATVVIDIINDNGNCDIEVDGNNSNCYNTLWQVWQEGEEYFECDIDAKATGTTIFTVKLIDLSNNTVIDSKNITVYISAKTYTISYNANGGSGAPASQTKTHGTALTLSNTIPTRTGYTFLGWSTSSTATTATYSAGSSFTTNANTTLYAVWKADRDSYIHIWVSDSIFGDEPSKYYVGVQYWICYEMYDKNTGDNLNSYISGGYDVTITAYDPYGDIVFTGNTLSNTDKDGFSFKPQYEGEYKFVVSVEGVVSGEFTETIEVESIPVKTYTVSYNANGGTGAPSSQTNIHGTVLTLSNTIPTRTGYTFLGWSESSTATTATYQPGDSFTTNADITLYAVWQKDSVTPDEPEYNYTFSIQEPSRITIRNRDGIILHANVEGIAPAGSYVEWTSNNNNFDIDESADGTKLTAIAENKGYTTFTATLYDAEGNILATDNVELYSKSGFFDKIGGFFRSLFGSTKIYEN